MGFLGAFVKAVADGFQAGQGSGIDRRADAYARQFSSVFIGRYLEMAKVGRISEVPAPIRAQIEAFATGRIDIHAATVSIDKYVYVMLYEHRARTGRDYPLP